MNERILAAPTPTDSNGGNDGTGIVLANFGRSALVQTETEAVHCGIRGRQLRVVCGDRVRWSRPAPGGAAAIQDVEKRTNVLERIDSRGRGEAIAANIQRLAIVIAPEPQPDWFILDRYLASARLKDIPALLILNKCDLDVASIAKDLTVYRRLQIECHEIIAKRAETLAQATQLFQFLCAERIMQQSIGIARRIEHGARMRCQYAGF